MNFDVINKADKYIIENIDKELTVESVSKHVNYSQKRLNMIFKEVFNCNVSEYINRKKMIHILQEIVVNKKTIGYIADKYQYVGSSLSRIVRSRYGRSPKEFIGQYQLLDEIMKEDAKHLQNYLALKNTRESLDSLQNKGLFKYKFTQNKQEVIISNVNYKWFYKYLESRPPIPLPVAILETIKNMEVEDLALIISCAYFQFDCNKYNINSMTWNLDEWRSIADNPNEKFEKMYSEILFYYDLQCPKLDPKTNLLWYCPNSDLLEKVSKIMISQHIKECPIGHVINKNDFLEFAEAAEKINLVKFTGNIGATEFTIDFNAKVLIDVIFEMGTEVSFVAEFMKDLQLKETIMFLLAVNKEFNASLSTGKSFIKSTDELIIKFIVVLLFYDLHKPRKVKNYHKYKVNPFIFEVLKSLCEIQDKKLGEFALSYDILINSEKEDLQLTLAEPFLSLYTEEIANCVYE